MSDRTHDQHADTVREAMYHERPLLRPRAMEAALEAGDESLAALARLAADAEQLRDALRRETLISNEYARRTKELVTGLETAIRKIEGTDSATADHNREWVRMLRERLPNYLAVDVDALASPPAETEPRATICEECGSGILDGKHIADYPCSRRADTEQP